MRRYLLPILLVANLLALSYAAGRCQRPTPEPSVELRWSEDRRWVEVYADGQIVAEYCEQRDGDLFRHLAEALEMR